MKYTLLLISISLFLSCKKDVVYSEYRNIPKQEWAKDSIFTFDVAIDNPLDLYEVCFLIRNTNDFQRQNLWLKIDCTHNGNTTSDTANVYLVDDYGVWRGSGVGSSFDGEYIYKQNCSFDSSGIYTYKISHLMRTDTLIGIEFIGLSVEKQKN